MLFVFFGQFFECFVLWSLLFSPSVLLLLTRLRILFFFFLFYLSILFFLARTFSHHFFLLFLLKLGIILISDCPFNCFFLHLFLLSGVSCFIVSSCNSFISSNICLLCFLIVIWLCSTSMLIVSLHHHIEINLGQSCTSWHCSDSSLSKLFNFNYRSYFFLRHSFFIQWFQFHWFNVGLIWFHF